MTTQVSTTTHKTSWGILLVPFTMLMLLLICVVAWQAKPVLLWTDILIFILVLSISFFVVSASRKEHLRDPFRQVLRSRMGMAALMILLMYVVVGLMDSIHFRMPLESNDNTGESNYSSQVLSLLDVVVTPIREQGEKTYSAPFAAYQYAKETIELSDGTRVREYPRLVYGGAHLTSPETELQGDIIALGLRALFFAIFAWLLLILGITYILSRRWQQTFGVSLAKLVTGRTELPWRTMCFVAGVFCLMIFLTVEYGAKYHILGTDKVGQDVFYQSIKSIRTGLVIGTLTTLIMLPFAVMLGIMAGYFKGWIDDVIQYLYTTLNSIPGVLLIAAAVLMMQVYIANNPDLFETDTERADVRLFFLCIILGITSWTGLCRMLRGETLKLREVDYVQASTAFGVSNWKILVRHIQPNVMHIVLIAIVLDFSGLVLAEAVLSYVGVGVDPTTHSWGNLINGARLEMAREPIVWWSLLAAFMFMFTLVLAANVFSDAVRDAFDPRIRKR